MTIDVTFWQNMPSHHMAPVQRELARAPGYRVRAVFVEDISDHRREMGWAMPDFEPAECIILNQDVDRAIKLAKQPTAINFFGGFPAGILRESFENLPSENGRSRVALILEAGDTHNLKGKFRPIYHAICARRFCRKTDFVLAFGQLGVGYYERCGFDPERIYPFSYQSDRAPTAVAERTPNPFRIVYCGGLHRRKGVDLLLRALAPLSHFDWSLEIIGDGPDAGMLRRLSERLNISSRIVWSGFVRSSEIVERLQHHDICVVPSRHDGWGMVTNEALSAGLAVITTSRVGSKDLVEASGAGCVATPPTANALRRCLKKLLSSPAEIADAKAAAARVSGCITPVSIADYLKAIIDYERGCPRERPLPPWAKKTQP